jgi:competence protein ComEC
MPTGLVLVAAAMAGITAGVGWDVSPARALALATASVSLAIASDRAVWRRALVVAAIAAAGAAHGAGARARALAPPLGVWLDARAPEGRAGEPVLVRGRLAADAARAPAGVRLLIDVHEVREDGVWRRAPGRVQAHVAGSLAGPRVDDWRGGRAIRAPVALRRPQLLRNPGAPPIVWQTLRQPFDLVGSIKSATLAEVAPGPWWSEWPATARARVRAAVGALVPSAQASSAAVIVAILIGDRVGLDDDVERRLQAAGTYHTIAISGGNVAIVTAIAFFGCRLVLRSATASACAALLVIVIYSAVVGPQPAVSRAVVAACVYLALWMKGLVPRGVHTLATVGLVLAIVDPLMVIDIGAWLSFGAALGILLGAGRLVSWLSSRMDQSQAAQSITRLRRVTRAGLALLAATIAAELALLPVAASVFSRVGVAGLALNFVAIPAMTIVQMAGLALVACDGWWAGGAAVSAAIAGAAARALLDSSSLVDVLPWLSWRVPPAGAGWTIGFYAALCASLTVETPRRWRRALAATAVVCAGVILTAPFVELAAPRAGRLRVTTIDVGQGDAILVQFPSGRALLVDTGGSSGAFDVGTRVVTPAIWALGARRLDWLAVTHPDLDHIGGARSIVRDLQPREVWEGMPVPPNRERAQLREAVINAGGAWRPLRAGQALETGGVTVDVLHPPPPDWERQKTRNEDSLVLHLTFGLVEVWLTGDAGPEFESHLTPAASRGTLRILKVAHHGSRSSSSPDFLAAIRPDIALVSAGRANLFGHPAPEVLARFDRYRTQVFRTDRDGAVMLDTDGRTVEVSTMSGRRWTLRVEGQ